LFNIINDSLQYYNSERLKSIYSKDSVFNIARAKVKDSLDLVYKKWYNSLSPNGKKSLQIIKLKSIRLSYPNSAGGCDATFYYTNVSDKIIKYINWNGSAKNAVNDIVSCDVSNRKSFSGRETGPVNKGEEGGGHWKNILYNSTARELIITDINIIYMDGSTFSLTKQDINLLMNKPNVDILNLSSQLNKVYDDKTP